jgi:hypothetical protein
MGMWFVAVHNPGNNTVGYLMQATEGYNCPNECSGNGNCVAGVCSCKETYASYDCSSQDLTIASSVEVSGVVSAAQWNYYNIKVLSTNALHVRVMELDTVGKVWVYMIKSDTGVLPTQNNYAYANTSNTHAHDILIPSINATGTWYIGCFGSPYLGFDEPEAQYGLVALLGCGDYKRCSECVQDPNCGWCATTSGESFCTSGTPEKPFNSKVHTISIIINLVDNLNPLV